MDNIPQGLILNLREIYTQFKQRIDLDIDFSNKKVQGKTKLTFVLKTSEINNVPDLKNVKEFILKLNCENIYVKRVSLYQTECDDMKGTDNSDVIQNFKPQLNTTKLSFKNTNPLYTKTYLDALYNNIEDNDSFKNLNRIEWEIRQEGNLVITIFPSHILNNVGSISNKLKIMIEYELVEKYIGIIFQNFYDEKIDMEYDICYTPNFYYNTPCWVPCIYDLRNHILWRLYLILPNEYAAFCSCQLTCIYQDPNMGKQAFYYKSKEPLCARNVGLIVTNEKIFNRLEDPNNKTILYIINENKRDRLEKNLVNNGLINAVFNFYDEFFESDVGMNSNLSSNTFIVFIPYLMHNSTSCYFSKYFSVKDENYFNFIKFPNLYILPDKLMYTSNIPELVEFQLKNLGKLFITNYIGGLINEASYSDFWIINGIENWLSDHFLMKCFGQNFLKSKIHKYISKFKKISKHGKEKRPLFTNSFTHPAELQLDEIVYLKSTLVLHLLESQVEKIFVQKALKNIINERHKNGYNVSTETFIKIFKKNCGINLKHFMNLWIFKTGMLDLNLKYSYNKRTNSIDVEVFQNPVSKECYEEHPLFKIKELNYETLDKYGKKIYMVDFKCRPVRYFDVNLHLIIYQTNGIEIMRDSHQIKLENEKESLFQNFPLIAKIRKAPIKKREQEFIQELISNTSIAKVYSNEEIEKALTQNSIMWVRVDPEITHIRTINITQQHIIYDYIKLFKEGDVIGQYESLKNIYNSKDHYSHSLTVLETFIRSGNFYKLRLYALKLYVKIILKSKNEDGYTFLLDFLDDLYAEILKNKTQLIYDNYFMLKRIIKYLGNYREDHFNEFFVIGRVTNSSIQNKIIDKFLSILVSNDLNIINGFNDSYIMREIFIGCSKLNLQEKTFFLLKKIIKTLRIEKLKRSFNEIMIISSIEAFLNILVKNEFFSTFNDQKELKTLVSEILNEVNHFINSDCENYELRVFLDYFQIYLIFFKSKNFIEFAHNVKYLILGDNYNNPVKSISCSLEENETFFSKVIALYYLINQINFTFDNLNEKCEMVNSMKEILQSPRCYYRIDSRVLMESLYCKIFNKPIENSMNNTNNQTNVMTTNNILSANIGLHSQINSNNANFLHNLNKNWINFAGKKYADEEWLYALVRGDQRDKEDYLDPFGHGNKYAHSDMSSETHSRFGVNKHFSLIKKYQSMYPSDSYAISNSNVETEKDWKECCTNILNNLINHPLAGPFYLPLNEETLGDLYKQYHQMIKHPIDLYTIQNKLNNNEYNSIVEFNRDILLVFSNCRDFNVKGSELYDNANQLDDYFRIMLEPFRKKNLESFQSSEMPEIKIKLQSGDVTI